MDQSEILKKIEIDPANWMNDDEWISKMMFFFLKQKVSLALNMA